MYFEEMGCDDMPNMASNRNAKDTSESAAPLVAEQVQKEEAPKDKQPVQSPCSSEQYESAFTKGEEIADKADPTSRTVSALGEQSQIKT